MKIHKMGKTFTLIIIAAILLVISGCADNETVDQCLTGHKYGFFGGIWHGFIAPFDFIGMLLSDDITMYAQNNNGALYALGFLIGSGGWGFMGSRGVHRIHRRRVNVRTNQFDEAEIVG